MEFVLEIPWATLDGVLLLRSLEFGLVVVASSSLEFGLVVVAWGFEEFGLVVSKVDEGDDSGI